MSSSRVEPVVFFLVVLFASEFPEVPRFVLSKFIPVKLRYFCFSAFDFAFFDIAYSNIDGTLCTDSDASSECKDDDEIFFFNFLSKFVPEELKL